MISKAVALLYFVLAFFLLYTNAHAQDDHAQFHPYYQNWVNQRGNGCCNNQDCGTLKDGDERTTQTGIEIKIDGQWCPVQPWHYLKKGNAPDWSSSHACIRKKESWPALSPCERLLCYQPRPGI